eukprot:CAMPEP_0181098404 /NCGR_PEP_ID=MMETSP1071-20121207/12108_1 /TAXON_ID=35127 /ORGANISM="Thalassiosira sp., Strain NH16" /LENGTH=721 /DNA_ID=CAMNT_0023180997 /DNA_START=727 /DNA_END=2892 /DNA_ORIENTATION=+
MTAHVHRIASKINDHVRGKYDELLSFDFEWIHASNEHPNNSSSNGHHHHHQRGYAKLLCEGDGTLLDYAKDGSSYKCVSNEEAAHNASNGNGEFLYGSLHDELPKTDIVLLNQRVGSITRMCEGGSSSMIDENATYSRCVLPTGNATTNINSPMPIRTRKWMTSYELFRNTSMIVYYSTHVHRSLMVLALDANTRMWSKVNDDIALEFEPRICRSLHSPSIYVDEEKQMFYMYVHGHNCKPLLNVTKTDFQPTLMYVSKDGTSWKLPERFLEQRRKNRAHSRHHPYFFTTLFYMTNPVWNVEDGYHYALARAKNEPDVVLCRSFSLEGPFEEGPRLAKSLRHFDVFMIKRKMYVLYSMIGDRPERILLASIDTTMSADWKEWKLLPGPRVLTPQYWYEHGNSRLVTSREGVARSRHRISDPRLLLDDDSLEDNTGATSSLVSGLLFYSVQGEREIAVARLSIDLDSYHEVISYRDRADILPEVLDSTSLAPGDEDDISMNATDILIAGVDWAVTTMMCTLLQRIGIVASHDYDIDGGSYPGPDGAVSKYDIFATKEWNRRYKHVIHMVNEPLQAINSMVAKCEREKSLSGHEKDNIMSKYYEEGYSGHHNDTSSCSATFALKYWVLRNYFIERHNLSWRVQSDNAFSEPLTIWELCMSSGFGHRCPVLSSIEIELRDIPSNLRSHYTGAVLSTQQGHLDQKTVTDDCWEAGARRDVWRRAV